AVNGSKSAHHEEKAKPVKTNGHHPRSKRKVFNYEKFYTEMVLQGPAPVIGVEMNGYEMEMNRLANSNGYSNGHQVEPQKADTATALSANSELIANQRTIIEEQKRL